LLNMNEAFTRTEHLGGRVTLYGGDNRDVLRSLPDCSIDSIVTDPPYALVSIVKRFANSPRSENTENIENPYGRTGRGFMGQRWDTGEVAFSEVFWTECLRVLKPGGHVVAFSGTRTYHRMAVAIEDAGFEIRDQLAWAYGSGFPKSHDVSKAIDKAAGVERKVVGTEKVRDIRNGHGRAQGDGINAANRDGPIYMERELTSPATAAAREWQGWGTALKPAWEPICLARKPLVGTVAANVLEHGTGALNIDGCRIETDPSVDDPRLGGKGAWTTTQQQSGDTVSLPRGTVASSEKGRWPANIVHDGSDEVVAAFPVSVSTIGKPRGAASGEGWGMTATGAEYADAGSAARFFYTAKADAEDRLGSKHPTVKPLDLMQYLCRLVTPPGGTVLDPFAGTGTTGEAAWREGFRAVLIEREEEYQADIARRMDLAAKPTKRAAVAKTKNKLLGAEDTPLFSFDNDNNPAAQAA
jgi:DNA modification methylase